MSGTRYITSVCNTVGCVWRSEDIQEDKLSGLETMHTNVTGHTLFMRGTVLHTEDEIVVGDYLVGSRRTIVMPEKGIVPERAGREGDTEPMPTINDGPNVQALVMADIRDRMALGIKRYGTVLQPHNGRNPLRDAYEEALDLAVYLRQALYEQENPQ